MKDDAYIPGLPLPSFVPRRYRPGNLGNLERAFRMD